jgi:hypothetical protein
LKRVKQEDAPLLVDPVDLEEPSTTAFATSTATFAASTATFAAPASVVKAGEAFLHAKKDFFTWFLAPKSFPDLKGRVFLHKRRRHFVLCQECQTCKGTYMFQLLYFFDIYFPNLQLQLQLLLQLQIICKLSYT